MTHPRIEAICSDEEPKRKEGRCCENLVIIRNGGKTELARKPVILVGKRMCCVLALASSQEPSENTPGGVLYTYYVVHCTAQYNIQLGMYCCVNYAQY